MLGLEGGGGVGVILIGLKIYNIFEYWFRDLISKLILFQPSSLICWEKESKKKKKIDIFGSGFKIHSRCRIWDRRQFRGLFMFDIYFLPLIIPGYAPGYCNCTTIVIISVISSVFSFFFFLNNILRPQVYWYYFTNRNDIVILCTRYKCI